MGVYIYVCMYIHEIGIGIEYSIDSPGSGPTTRFNFGEFFGFLSIPSKDLQRNGV